MSRSSASPLAAAKLSCREAELRINKSGTNPFDIVPSLMRAEAHVSTITRGQKISALNLLISSKLCAAALSAPPFMSYIEGGVAEREQLTE